MDRRSIFDVLGGIGEFTHIYRILGDRFSINSYHVEKQADFYKCRLAFKFNLSFLQFGFQLGRGPKLGLGLGLDLFWRAFSAFIFF